MAKKASPTTTDMRRCIGSRTFGIEAHEAPVDDFPVQPSQKDGLGRMCKPHWRRYTNALRKVAVSRKAAETTTEPIAELEPTTEMEQMADAGAEAPATRRGRRAKVEVEPEEVVAG